MWVMLSKSVSFDYIQKHFLTIVILSLLAIYCTRNLCQSSPIVESPGREVVGLKWVVKESKYTLNKNEGVLVLHD